MLREPTTPSRLSGRTCPFTGTAGQLHAFWSFIVVDRNHRIIAIINV
jgi:hypothetical protein